MKKTAGEKAVREKIVKAVSDALGKTDLKKLKEMKSSGVKIKKLKRVKSSSGKIRIWAEDWCIFIEIDGDVWWICLAGEP